MFGFCCFAVVLWFRWVFDYGRMGVGRLRLLWVLLVGIYCCLCVALLWLLLYDVVWLMGLGCVLCGLFWVLDLMCLLL